MTSARITGVGANRSKSVENALVLGCWDNCLKLNGLSDFGDWHDITENLVFSGCRLEYLSGGIVDESLLGLILTSGEQDELALVLVKSCDVDLQLLLTGASSSVINSDSNGSCEISAQSSALDFGEGKSSTEADLASILAGLG